jgi:hypothetical protein
MGEHLYEVGFQKVTAATAGVAICEIAPAGLAAGKRPAEIREIGIFNYSGVFNEVGIGRPAAIGTGTLTTVTVQATDSMDVIAGNTTVNTAWGTASPTVPGAFMRRFPLQAVAGAGEIFVWNPGEFVLWSGAAINTVVIWQFVASIVTYDLYVKVAE